MKLEMMADMTFANGKEMRYLAEMECDLTAVSDLKKNGKKTNIFVSATKKMFHQQTGATEQ